MITINLINTLIDTDVVEVDSDSAPPEHVDNSGHPQFTALVRGPGQKLCLSDQHFEVKLVIRKAMDLIVDLLLFQNGFPSLATRAIWNRRTLILACSLIEQSTGSYARQRYQQLSQRMKADAEYVKELSKLVSIQ